MKTMIEPDPPRCDVATSDLVIRAQSAFSAATGYCRNGGDLTFQSGKAAPGGKAGRIRFVAGETEVLRLEADGRMIRNGEPICCDPDLGLALLAWFSSCSFDTRPRAEIVRDAFRGLTEPERESVLEGLCRDCLRETGDRPCHCENDL